MKRKPAPKPYTGPTHPVGTVVKVLRPNLWAGHIGEVVKVVNGIHTVRHTHCIILGDKSELEHSFHLNAPYSELEPV